MQPALRLRRALPRELLLAALLALAALTVQDLAGALRPPAAPSAPTAGAVLDFTVEDLDGQPVSLSSLRGQVVLVNFWATWCSPCKEEMPVLQAYYDAHRGEGFTLVGLNVSDDPAVAADFAHGRGYSFPLWFDPPGDTLIDLRLRGLPASILVDADGRRLERWIGPLTTDMLDAAVGPHLPAPAYR
jgi:thiol-disulfide isomerase/thioredoxin